MKKIMTVLAAAGMLMLGIAGQAQAADDGGHPSCARNGGSNANCHLYHIELGGNHHCVDFTLDKQTLIKACRKNSISVYLDPGVFSTIAVNLDTAFKPDEIQADNKENWCFRLANGSRTHTDDSGTLVVQNYVKLQVASLGNKCNEN
jgi:hypothetical protein